MARYEWAAPDLFGNVVEGARDGNDGADQLDHLRARGVDVRLGSTVCAALGPLGIVSKGEGDVAHGVGLELKDVLQESGTLEG